MYPYTFSSNIYSRAPHFGYNFKHLAAHPHPLDLRQSRLAPQSFAYQINSPYTRDTAYYPSNDRLESLRLQVQEEEQVAKLEALRQRRHELEQEEIKSAVERHRREIEELAHRERAMKLHEFEIAREAEELRRLGVSAAAVAAQASSPTRLSYPPAQYTTNFLGQQVMYCPCVCNAERNANIVQTFQHDEVAKVFVKRRSEEPSLSNLSARRTQQFKIPDVQRPNIPEKSSASQASAGSAAFVDFDHILNLLESANQSKREERKLSPSQFRQTAVPQAVPKERFERRLGNEYAKEVHDTIQAFLNSLEDWKTTPPPVPQPSSVNNHAMPIPQDKGKSKELPAVATEFKSFPEDVGGAMTCVKDIESRFHALENEFVFPDKVDFVTPALPGASPAHFTTHLAYTANNQPIRFYEHTLNRLLNQLDSVNSFGNEGLRNRRKNVVQKVEHALEVLEQEVRGRWIANAARESKKHKVIIEDVTSPEEYLMSSTSVTASQDPNSNTEKVPIAESTPAPSQPIGEPIPSLSQPEVADRNTTESEAPTEQVPAAAADGVPAQGASEATVEAEAVEIVTDNVEDPPVPSFLPESSVGEASEGVHLEDSESIPTPLSSEITEPAPNLVPSHDVQPREGPLADSQDDLSATVRVPMPVVEEPLSPMSTAPSDLDGESGVSENEAGGFLLEDGLMEDEMSKHISDAESIASDWSEMDAPTH
ncbi:hypothetical protein P691DRAFT_7460 [Macrolepiota fuliginosa MF-IS2]|uniref:BAG domain-containing protein n=1 Tax=Macrolepiota fuliginosa MF-IS2 TaxID=1400762 RepID=A0A9P5XP37_9AGAR|nr:hypothetical protein P691DRAFT_7460 [Macrolepiota fuliginosa MF-IS2]